MMPNLEVDLRVAAVKSTKSTWGMSSQVKSYLIQVAANFFPKHRRHNIPAKSTQNYKFW